MFYVIPNKLVQLIYKTWFWWYDAIKPVSFLKLRILASFKKISWVYFENNESPLTLKGENFKKLEG